MDPRVIVCEQKHTSIDKEIDAIKVSQKEHGDRIAYLEKMSAVREEQVMNLVKSIDSLVMWLKWILGILTTASIGLLIWFFQKALV